MNTATNLTTTTNEITEDLTAEEITFSHLVAKGYTLTQAYRKAFPAKSHLQNNTVRVNASALMTKTNISTEVATHRKRSAHMARLAEDRLTEVLEEGDINNKHHKVPEVSMFMYEQANGKARQTTEVIGKHVMVTYDLSGGSAGAVPKEVLDALADDEQQG